MEPITIALLIGLAVLIICVVVVSWIILQRQTKKDADSTVGITNVQQQLESIRTTLDNRLHQSNESVQKVIQRQSDSTQRVIKDVIRELSEVKQTGKDMLSFTEQLTHLEKILANPRERGELGEYYLESVLANVLSPNLYAMQHTFKDGTRADAVIFLMDKRCLQ